eukprot:TRINITY_DN59076_c0_g1_i1.p1 TRINITY_DN59076_c0_g1~~TRINITY_DN59076_c0_g1_i1.p1  ORF type:complete len:610 (+),score=95.09 TRINITY_DN59076_c0_g1_i1:57-1832(+)
MENNNSSATFGPKLGRDNSAALLPLRAVDISEHFHASLPASQEFQAVLAKLAEVHADVVCRLKNEIRNLESKLDFHDDVTAKEQDTLEVEEQVPVMPATGIEEAEARTAVVRFTEVGGARERCKTLSFKEKLQMGTIDDSMANVRKTAHRITTVSSIGSRRVLYKNSLYHLGASANYQVNCRDWSVACLVDHPLFNVLSGVIILVNAVSMGIEVELLAAMAQTPLTLIIANETCSLYFLLELMLRIYAHRSSFFRGEGRGWNLFDMALVFLSVVDYLGELVSGSSALKVMQGFKTLKMLRIVRLFRVVRFFRQLYMLVIMIIDSVKQLIWATVLLLIVIYVFAVVLTGNCSTFLQSLSVQDTDNQNLVVTAGPSVGLGPLAPVRVQEIEAYYGHLHLTIYTLFQTLLGGVSWRDVCNPLFRVDIFSPILFLAYVTFVMVAVLNIITGVFVENAMVSAKMERNYLVEQEVAQKESYLRDFKKFFEALDVDGNGDIEIHEVVEILDDPTLAAYLRVLGLEVHDAERLFRLLDADDSGVVNLTEFLEGCMRVKGVARSIDMYAVMAECRRTNSTLETVLKILTHEKSPGLQSKE